MKLLPCDEDWACFLDGDSAFLRSDFGHKILEYTLKYPDTGLFTCYASRAHYRCQRIESADPENPSILFHKAIADKADKDLRGQIKEISRRIAGHLLLMKKQTWLLIRQSVKDNGKNKRILGIDTKISNAILWHGLKIRLMRGIYIFHYLRMAEGYDYKKHLK